MAGVLAVEQHGVLACGGGEQFCAETEARGWRWGKKEEEEGWVPLLFSHDTRRVSSADA
jgi:hypothetical protein